MSSIIDEINMRVDAGEFPEPSDGVLAMTKQDGDVDVVFKGDIDVFASMFSQFLDLYSEETGVEKSMILYAMLDRMGFIDAPESQQVS